MAVPSVGGPRLIGWRSGQTRTTDLPEVRENPSCRLLRGGPGLLPEDLETNISSSWVSGLLPHLRISGLVSLCGTMSQFLVIDISPLSTCLSTHPPIHLSVLSLSLHICLLTHSPSYLAIYPSLSVQLPTYPWICIPFYPSIPLSIICQSRYLSIHPPLSPYLSTHPSPGYLIYPSRHLSLHPSTCLYYLGINSSIIIYLPSSVPN